MYIIMYICSSIKFKIDRLRLYIFISSLLNLVSSLPPVVVKTSNLIFLIPIDCIFFLVKASLLFWILTSSWVLAKSLPIVSDIFKYFFKVSSPVFSSSNESIVSFKSLKSKPNFLKLLLSSLSLAANWSIYIIPILA